MKKLSLALALAVALTGCSKGEALEATTGSDVTLQKKDGVTVAGRLVEVKPDHVVVETRNGVKTPVQRADIVSLRADGDAVGSSGAAAAKADDPKADDQKPGANAVARIADRSPEYREVTIPAGTLLRLDLQTAVGSDTSHVEDPVRATLRQPVTVDGLTALPTGTAVTGHVTAAERSARVKGRGRVAFRFTRIDPPGDAGRMAIQTGVVSLVAPGTKKQDAAKIGGGAAGGAIIGGILGGGDGAAKGAVIGGAAGTGVVLSTRGKEVRLGRGADLSVKLRAPVTVRVLIKK